MMTMVMTMMMTVMMVMTVMMMMTVMIVIESSIQLSGGSISLSLNSNFVPEEKIHSLKETLCCYKKFTFPNNNQHHDHDVGSGEIQKVFASE